MKSPTSQLERRLTEVCRMYYERAISKSDIARKTNLSVTHVNRLLQQGVRTGVVEIRVNSRTLKALETSLMEVYGLRESRVVLSSSKTENTRIDLGRAAAELFDEVVSDGANVGVGSGRTLFEMVSCLPDKSRSISIFPVNLVLEQESNVTGASANNVATIAWFRSRPSAKASRLELFFPSKDLRALLDYAHKIGQTSAFQELSERILSLDTYFLGASDYHEQSQLTHLHNQMSPDSHGSETVVGDIAFNSLDAGGQYVDFGLGPFLIRVPADRLENNALSKAVVLVAGGKQKARVIFAALKARLCNALVTDSDTAEKLLMMKTSTAPVPSNLKEETDEEDSDLSFSRPHETQK